MITASKTYTGRKVANMIFTGLSTSAALFGIIWLTMILITLVTNGIGGLNLDLFVKETPAPGDTGGLGNAIVGSLIMIGIAMVIGTPIGVLAGTYLAEYGRHTKLAMLVRNLNDILLSAPSIVVGLFVYELMVRTQGHFSGLAGAFALAVIVIPVMVRTTENMLLLIPNALREAASALGAPTSLIIKQVTWKAAQAGMITGVLLAVARISGETAPLLFTALNNSYWSTDLNSPMASLPASIFQMAMSPYKDWHDLAWAGALLVTIAVLLLSILARLIGSSRR